jgi:glutathione S-transferase
MTDLFAFGTEDDKLDVGERYGTTGEMKKTQYVMQLLGHPGNADTLKCLLVAGEKGIELESGILDIVHNQQDTEDYRELSPFGIMPALKEAHYVCAGEDGITVFIEGRGLGNRLQPRNAKTLAEQMYWIDIARSNVAPHVEVLMQQQVIGPMSDPAFKADIAAVDAAREALNAPLDAIDKQLSGNEFVVGIYSYADVHWTAYIHLLATIGEAALLDQRRNVKAWLERIKTHKSFSGQEIIPYELMPTLEEIKTNRMKDVVCGEF